MLVLLAAIWGASYLFIRVASPALGPIVLMEARVVIAGVALFAFAKASGTPPDLRAHWRRFLVLGAIGSAAPFTLIAAAELYIPASLAAILNATTPLFSAVVAAAWLQEQFTLKRVIGLVLGITGVAVLMGWSPVSISGRVVFATVAMLLASLCYALGGTYAGRALRGVSPLTISIGQQLAASVVLFPFAAVTLPKAHPTMSVLANMLALALLCTAVAYMIYYPLLKSAGPTSALSVTFLIPVFGLMWGALFLHEQIGPGMVAGLAVILSSITLVTGMRLLPSRSPDAAGRSAAPSSLPRRAGVGETDATSG
jgi:drug/metabolite transporter (DMT)-like permease